MYLQINYALVENHSTSDNLDKIINEILERNEIEMSIPRKLHSLINKKIEECLVNFALEGEIEEQYCYFVKNINHDTNICFVHKFSKDGKTFQNIDASSVPSDTKKEDILVLKDGKLIVHTEITEKVAQLKAELLASYEESKHLFEIEGEEYFVSDKSDDELSAKMSLRTKDGTAERTGIDIDAELYHKIRYGSKVRFESGNYVIVE